MLSRMRMFGVVALVVLCVHGAAAQAAQVDLTGAWAFTIMSNTGVNMPTVTFKQDGEKLTGRYSSILLGETDLTGTVKGQAFEFTVKADLQGAIFEAKFIGTIENKDSVKGKMDSRDFGGGTFTGKRKEPEARKP